MLINIKLEQIRSMVQTNLSLQLKRVEKILTVTKSKFLDPSTIMYSGNDKPILSCGARVVIMTESEVKVIK